MARQRANTAKHKTATATALPEADRQTTESPRRRGVIRHEVRFIAVTVALAMCFAIYAAINYPYTYMSMEADGMWLSTRDFWQLKLSYPPAFTLWLTDFMLQWFGKPSVAATLHAILLACPAILADIWLTRLFPTRKAFGWFALLPALFIGYFCTFEVHTAVEATFAFTLLLAHSYIRNGKARLLYSFVSLPLGYMLAPMPMLAMMLVGMMLTEWKLFGSRNWRAQLAGFAVLYAMPIVYSEQVAFVPFQRRYTSFGSYFHPINSSAVQNAEKYRSYIILANEGKWNELLYSRGCQDAAQKGDGLALRFALLAESELGTLPDNIFNYPITQEDHFLFPHVREYVTTQFNRLFYLHLGIYDEAFHQAQEFGLLQFNGCCFSSIRQMTEYSIMEGEWEMADKYLRILEKTSCHGDYIAEKCEEMAKAKKTFTRQVPLRADNFVGGYPLPFEMLRLFRYYNGGPYAKKILDYALLSFMLREDRPRFGAACKWGSIYTEDNLPGTYRNFLQGK